MKLATDVHLGGLSPSQTVLLEWFGVEQAQSTIHYCVKQDNLEPVGDVESEQVALDETEFKIIGERFWLFAAVDSSTN